MTGHDHMTDNETGKSRGWFPRGGKNGSKNGERKPGWLASFSLTRMLFPARDEQLRYLSQSARLREAVNPRLVRATAMTVSAAVFIFLAWAAITNINEIARTPGEVVPFGFEKTVQHLDGGVIAEILTHEGDMVEAGQLLLRLDSGGVKEDLTRARKKQWALQVQAERLRAFAESRIPDFGRFGNRNPLLIAEQQQIFETMVQAREQQADVIRSQVEQKRQDLTILKSRLATTERNLKAERDIYDRYKTLHDKGVLSYVRLSEAEQAVNASRGERETLREQINQAETSIGEFGSRLKSLGAVQRDEAYRELHLVEAELAQNSEIVSKLARRDDRLELRAPVRGIVKGMTVNTIGGVVQPGQEILSVLPLDERLVVETRIPPQYIGHVAVGQPVQIKVSAYDYSRYGSLEGRLDFISATTFRSEKNERYYGGRVIFDETALRAAGQTLPILPGMTVMAEIVTGEKTILEYLLKPVRTAFDTAFSEK